MYCKNCGKKITEGAKFCKNCGALKSNKDYISERKVKISNPVEVPVSGYVLENKISKILNKNRSGWWVVGIISAIIIIGIVINAVDSNSTTNVSGPVSTTSSVANDQPVALSVVNILCDNNSGGSGTIITKEGLIMTNNHVIEGAGSCAISIPDPVTGTPDKIYEAKPVIIPKLSKQYDIAALNISSSYTDSDGKTWGGYPTTFPAYQGPDICASSTSKLGDSIRIYGYPVTSGGYNLTITDGIISSFTDDGNILTSAKIDSGNSGGLAIDQDGCFVGIPSAVLTGKYQNLGVIISVSNILDFSSQLQSKQSSN